MNPVVLGLALFFVFGGLGVKAVIDSSVPTTYDAYFKKYGSEFKVDWLWLKRICMIESSMGRAKSVAHGLKNPSDIEGSKSSDGLSWGVMQFTLATARDMDPNATVEKLNNPEYSIRLAAKYVAFLKTRFPSTDSRYVEWVIKSYNQGPGNSAKERAGTSPGYAAQYWSKYSNYSQKIA